MNNQDIRIGIIGAGANTRSMHIPGFLKIDGVSIAAVANRTMESSERAAKELNIPEACAHWEDVIDDPSVDAICIGTWPYMHEAATVAALDAGKHVLCEARMASNLEEALSMHGASKQYSNLVAQLVPAPMSLAADAQITSLIGNGDLGDITAIDVTASTADTFNADAPMSWRQDADYSGRNTMSLGIWYEIIMRWVGTAKNVSAISKLTTPWGKDENGCAKPITIPDHLEVIGEMINGATLHMRISSATNFDQSGVSIYGTKGTIRFSNGKLFHGIPGKSEMEEIPLQGKAWSVESDFIDSIRNGTPVRLSSFEDGVRYMAFTDAVLSSAAKRETSAVEVF